VINEGVTGYVIPEKPSGRIIDIGQVVVEHVFVSNRAPEIVGALFAPIIDLPGLLVIVTGDGGGGPEMTITGDFPAVVEVIQHAELQRQLMLVGRDIPTVHRERRVAIADFTIPK